MNYKYGGKDFSLELNDKGQIECADLGVCAPTVEDVKKLIREQVEKEKSLPRVSVLLLSSGDRWGEKAGMIEATSTLKEVGNGHYHQELWVTYKDAKGKTVRGKKWTSSVYQDTPENRAAMEKYAQLKNEIHSLESECNELESILTNVSTIKV